MTTALVGGAGKANANSEQLFGNCTANGRPLAAVMRKLRELYPAKTAANIAVRAGVSVRSAEHWLSGDRDMGADAFVSLLLSADGDKIIEAIMFSLPKQARPRWWTRHANTARMAAIERLQAEQDDEIRQLRLDMTRK